MRRLRNIGRLFTGTSAGVIEDAAVICDGDKIAWCGKHGEEPHEMLEAVIEDDDCGGGLVTAGLVDEVWLLRGRGAVGADGVAALATLPLSAITGSPGFKVRASETLQEDILTIYERA